jgi:Sulfotransferase family
MASKTVFFCIGAHKAGTTWLHSVLVQYPDCALPEIKEVHFFDNKHLSGDLQPASIYTRRLALLSRLASGVERQLLGQLDPPPDAAGADAHRKHIYAGGSPRDPELTRKLNRIIVLAKYLRIRDSDDFSAYLEDTRLRKGTSVVGEFTPAYAMLPAAGFRDIVTTFPDAKFIYVMRDPVDRFWSQLRFKKRRLATHAGDMHFDPNEHLPKALKSSESLSRSDYPRTIRTLESVVPADRILYLFFEELFSRQSVVREMRRLEQFLGLNPMAADWLLDQVEERKNASESIALKEDNRRAAEAALRPIYEFVRQKFGTVPTGWHPPAH